MKRAPQSNQRGIELEKRSRGDALNCSPQSNQRGIELFRLLLGFSPAGERLNRTSVGLNSNKITHSMWGLRRLNRTSVGLNIFSSDARASAKPGLNRTSVGLNKFPPAGSRLKCHAPQSNQRGIETPSIPFLGGRPWWPASIEPAWD